MWYSDCQAEQYCRYTKHYPNTHNSDISWLDMSREQLMRRTDMLELLGVQV